MTISACDRCGRNINPNKGAVKAEIISPLYRAEQEICIECLPKLKEFFKASGQIKVENTAKIS